MVGKIWLFDSGRNLMSQIDVFRIQWRATGRAVVSYCYIVII